MAKGLVFPALLALTVCAFFHRALISGCFFAVDFSQTFVPLRTILAHAWSRGLPEWTGRLGNGSPVLADPAYAVFYLPNLLYLGGDPARSLTVLTVAHYVFGGVGAWLLARRWAMSQAAAWLAAISFVLSGPAVSSTAYLNLAWPLAWLPWSVLAHEEARSGRRWLGVCGLALVWFSMFSMGDPVVLAAAIAGSLLLVATDVIDASRAEGWRDRLASAVVAPGVAAALALVLATPLLVAILRYLPSSVRGAGFQAGGIVSWSLHPILFVGFALTDPFGDPAGFGATRFWASALAPDHGHPLLAGAYVGALILALSVCGALRRTPVRWVLVIWLTGLVLLALGQYGPIYPLLRDRSGFDALRYPTKWIVPAMLPLALLAASGLDDLRAWTPSGRALPRGTNVFLVGLALMGAVSVGSMNGLEHALARLADRPDADFGGVPLVAHIRSAWLSAALRSAIPLALAVTALLLRRRATAARLMPWIAALATLDVALANTHLAPTAEPSFYAQPRLAQAILNDPAGHGRVYIEPVDVIEPPLRLTHAPHATQDADGMLGYEGAAAGLDLAFNADIEAFSPVIYARAGAMVLGAPLREKLMLLGAAGVTHVVSYRTREGLLSDPIAAIPGTYDRPALVYRNPLAVPRARVVPRLTPYAGDAGFISAVRGAPDDFFRHTALVEEKDVPPGDHAAEPPAAEGGAASILADDGRGVVIQVDGPGGYLILSDTLAPGWTARLDGRGVDLMRVDLAFRGVRVPPGAHRVEMSYSPW